MHNKILFIFPFKMVPTLIARPLYREKRKTVFLCKAFRVMAPINAKPHALATGLWDADAHNRGAYYCSSCVVHAHARASAAYWCGGDDAATVVIICELPVLPSRALCVRKQGRHSSFATSHTSRDFAPRQPPRHMSITRSRRLRLPCRASIPLIPAAHLE